MRARIELLSEISFIAAMQIGYRAIGVNHSEQNIHVECLLGFGYSYYVSNGGFRIKLSLGWARASYQISGKF